MSKKPFILAINAISGGGKTATTRALQKRLLNARALYFDDRNYDSDSGIEDICKWVEAGADVNRFDLRRLAEDIDNLVKENPDFIILDYPFGYRHKLLAPYLDYSIFIDTPLDVAMARRILRDYEDKIISDITDVLGGMRQYLEQGRSAYLFGLVAARESADFVVDGCMPVVCRLTRLL